MARATGYILRLTKQRYELFDSEFDDTFAEPVKDFDHSRNIPLLCLVVSPDNTITHMAQAKRGVRAGTGLRRLNLTEIMNISEIHVSSLLEQIPNRFHRWVSDRLNYGGLLTPKSFAAFVDALISLSPPLKSALARFGRERSERIGHLSEQAREALAPQKMAVATSLNIAGFSRESLSEWDPGESIPPSFLDGLPTTRLREDSMVINDLVKLPGHKLIRTMPYSAAVFEGETARLTVIMTNRLPLEEQFGTDLIYYNETYHSFIMIQYKAMEREKDESVFRLPNAQLDKEIKRMQAILDELKKYSQCNEKGGFRLNTNPFFLKLCSRMVFNPDDAGLIPGMYIPLDYWNVLSIDQSISGPKGGKAINYKNVGRYFDNTEFVQLVSKAWVGTTINQSQILEKTIQSSIESGKAVAIGIKTDIPRDPTEEESDEDDFDKKHTGVPEVGQDDVPW